MKYSCFDLGGTSLKSAVIDESGNLEYHSTEEVVDNFDSIIKLICDVYEKHCQVYPIEGIALSTPGSVDSEEGIIYGYSALPSIHGPNWKNVLEKLLRVPVTLANDATCAALAEVFSGAAQANEDVAVVVIGSGVGGAIIKDRKVHLGAHLYGGEIGYMVLSQEGNNVTTLSNLASTRALVEAVQKESPSIEWNGKKVFEFAEKGDKVCIKAVEDFFKFLSLGIFNLQHIYDPECILIGGAVSENETFMSQLNHAIDQVMSTVKISDLRPNVDRCFHGNNANLIGALAFHLQSVKYKNNGKVTVTN